MNVSHNTSASSDLWILDQAQNALTFNPLGGSHVHNCRTGKEWHYYC
jgi:hypothetical protein